MHTCFVENRSVLCKHLDTVEITAVSPSFDVDFVGNCQHDIDRSERFRSTNSGQRSVAWSTVPGCFPDAIKLASDDLFASVNDAANSYSS